MDGDGDFTIRGRLMSLVEKVSYLKKKMANLPLETQDKNPSEFSTHIWWKEASLRTEVSNLRGGPPEFPKEKKNIDLPYLDLS